MIVLQQVGVFMSVWVKSLSPVNTGHVFVTSDVIRAEVRLFYCGVVRADVEF
jgi:hypothetical protein